MTTKRHPEQDTKTTVPPTAIAGDKRRSETSAGALPNIGTEVLDGTYTEYRAKRVANRTDRTE
eukprot:4107208-Alexandrium_andersonii.AAC.1